MGRAARSAWLPLVLWPLGITAEIVSFDLLFGADGTPTAVELVSRSVSAFFIFCGLIAWQRRPDNRTGALMTLTGFLFLLDPLLSQLNSAWGYTLAQVAANWWVVAFAALILGFPTGRLSTPVDRWIVGAMALNEIVWQGVYILFLPFPEGRTNVVQVRADAHLADIIDTSQRCFLVPVGLLLFAVCTVRWLRARPPLRRLLLPTLGGGIASLILIVQVVYQLMNDEPSRATRTVTALVLVAVPLAFLLGLLRAQFARAGMADLVVALQRAPDSRRLGAVLSKSLRDPSLELTYWLPRFGCYVDADGLPVTLPEPGSERAVTLVDHHGTRVAALVHDASLTYQPDLLEVVCAAVDVALERERLQLELGARVAELQASRERIVAAGDAERRRLERNLHDGAQQRLVGIALQLRLIRGRIKQDPEEAEALVTGASDELAESLAELRELARGIHPAVLEHGLAAALQSLATRSAVATTLSYEASGRLPEPIERAGYFVACEALANVAKYAAATSVTMRVWRAGTTVAIEICDDGVGGADDANGTGLRGLADRVEALNGILRVSSPAGSGTTVTAELPCAS
jgi:signal transduction histidine kinase